MYIVIYKNGKQNCDDPLKRDTIEQAQAVDGEKYIFSWGQGRNGNNLMLNDPEGIMFYGEDKKPCNFKHEKYVLTQVAKFNSKDLKALKFIFRYDGLEDIIVEKTVNSFDNLSFDSVSQALCKAIKEIILASQLDSWAGYQYKLENEKLKTENKNFKHDIELLQKELADCKSKL